MTTGPLTCQFLEIFPEGNPGASTHAYAGNWRAAAVDTVSIDINLESVGTTPNIGMGDLELQLTSDPGTPADPNDDCTIALNLVDVGATAPGWQTYTFAVPAAQMTLPGGWTVDTMTPCGSGPLDAAWNQVIQDVDLMTFRYDSNPNAFCSFTSWIFGVDNIRVEGSPVSIGTNYCTAANNSTGAPGTIIATGSNVVAANNFILQASGLPASQFGIFVTSMAQGFVVGAGGTSNGNLCLAGTIGRFDQPAQILGTGSGGGFNLNPSLSAFPQGGAFAMVMPGSTWNFQAWHRDGVGMGSNFTDGIEVMFQ